MDKKIIFTQKANLPIGPYSQAVFANGFLFISGQIAGDKVGIGSIEEETNAVLENLKQILSASEMDFSHVVKSSIFLKDLNDFAKVNEIYSSFFKENPPARETVEVSRLPKDARVEISCIAFKSL